MSATIEINDALFAQMDRELAGLEMVARMPAIKTGMKAGVKVTETRYEDYVPRSTDRKEGKHLVETISSKVKEYPSGVVVSVIGAEYPAGAHAHLLEEGVEPHSIGEYEHPGFEGRHYLEAAVKDTESERDAAMLNGMKAAVEEAKRGAS